MPYVEPTYNLECNLYTTGIYPEGLRVVNAPCNLAYGRRVNMPVFGSSPDAGVTLIGMTLLLPKDVDIRGYNSESSADTCEVPSGSGRKYLVVWSDFIGYGFPNCHKIAILQQLIPWPTPDVIEDV